MKAIINAAILLLLYVAILFVITLCWVGAEYLFESHVHSSRVDGGVAGVLAYYITQYLWQMNKKLGKGGERGD